MPRRKFKREPTLRTARIVFLLMRGRRLTTAKVAEITGLSRFAAWDMMDLIASSHDVPLTYADGVWYIVGVVPTEME